MNTDTKKIYTAKSELVDYPVILTENTPKAIYPVNNESIIVLGEMGTLTDEKKTMILVAVENGLMPKSENMAAAFEYLAAADKNSYAVEIGYCTPELMSIYYEEFSNNQKLEKDQKSDSEYVRAFYEMLADAMERDCSDIHIEVRKNNASVRYRIDGELHHVKDWSAVFAFRFSQTVYSVIASEQAVTFKPSEPQDALIDKTVDGERIRVRLATIPAAPDGFDCIMRLLRLGKGGAQKILSLSQLGYSDDHVRLINAGLSMPVGAIIIAGTTGSGKSTTLKNVLMDVIDKSDGTIKVITVEDPPEYFIPGATQVPVSRNKMTSDGSSSFTAAVRAAMRSDPDILMVGEVRDNISASLLVSAVQSGHSAFSTVHAPSAISIVSRLHSMEVDRDILGSVDFIACLIYQALLSKLCVHCRKPYHPDLVEPDLANRIGLVMQPDSTVYLRGDGCDKCNNGIKGKTVVAEVILPDYTMRKYFAESNSIDAMQHWTKSGGKRIIEHGIQKMNAGIVSPQDVEGSLGILTSQLIMQDGLLETSEISMLPAELTRKIAKAIKEMPDFSCLDANDPKWNEITSEMLISMLSEAKPIINGQVIDSHVTDSNASKSKSTDQVVSQSVDINKITNNHINDLKITESNQKTTINLDDTYANVATIAVDVNSDQKHSYPFDDIEDDESGEVEDTSEVENEIQSIFEEAHKEKEAIRAFDQSFEKDIDSLKQSYQPNDLHTDEDSFSFKKFSDDNFDLQKSNSKPSNVDAFSIFDKVGG